MAASKNDKHQMPFLTKHSSSPEYSLLVAVLRSLSTKETLPAFKSLSTEFDWKAFHTLVHFHRIGPLIYDGLATHWESECPTDIIKRRQAHKQQRIKQSLSQKAMISRIHDNLTKANIPFLLMKGDAISERYYPTPSVSYTHLTLPTKA